MPISKRYTRALHKLGGDAGEFCVWRMGNCHSILPKSLRGKVAATCHPSPLAAIEAFAAGERPTVHVEEERGG